MTGETPIEMGVLGRVLGRGGAGEVREASLPGMGRVAIKLAHGDGSVDPRDVARAALEADALRRVEHRNVVRVLGSRRTEDGRFALVVPRLVGRTLREVLDVRSRLPWIIASRLAASVLDGLGAAHHAGVVHRDVKPSNVFIGREASEPRTEVRPILIDFGLARLDGRPGPGSTTSSVVGSPTYVAPEQVLGGAQDARTDLYALGVVLFEAITGAPPFLAADPARVLEAHLLDDPPELADVALVPRDLSRCVARALAKSPRARFPSAAAMAETLRSIAERAAARRPR
jgi:serine/threonine-protein kinase